MPTIEELLRTSLQGATIEFDQAVKDLRNEVKSASSAVETITDGLATLSVAKVEDTADSAVYRVNFVMGRDKREVQAFVVPIKGYPITVYDSVRSIDSILPGTKVKDGAELHQAFEKMAEDRTSPLVILLAYVLRNKDAFAEVDEYGPPDEPDA
jgi:hypothetical protein